MDKQSQKSIGVKEGVSYDEKTLAEQGLVEESFSAESLHASVEPSVTASSEAASSASGGKGYFMYGATDKMFSDSSAALSSSGTASSASGGKGYLMHGATDKMFSDSSPASCSSASDESASDESASDESASFAGDKVGFVGAREGSVEVIRYGQCVTLHKGDAILLKDIVVTGDESGAFLRFTDSKIMHQTLRLDEEQSVSIEDFLVKALDDSSVSQGDVLDTNWQVADGSVVLLPFSDDFSISDGSGSARGRLLQDLGSSDAASSENTFASREGFLQSASSRFSEPQAGNGSDLDYYSYAYQQEFSPGNTQGDTQTQGNTEGDTQGDSQGSLQEQLAQYGSASEDFVAEAASEPASQDFPSQSSPPSSFGSPSGSPAVPSAEELARLAEEQVRAQQAAEDQARAQQAAEEQASAQQAAEEQARAQQAAEEQALAQQAAEEQARAQQAAEEQALAQQAAEEQALAQQAAEEQARAQQAAEEQALAQQAAEEQARAQQEAEDKARAQKEADDKASAQKEAEEKEPEQEDFLFDGGGDWNSGFTQTSSETWDPQSSESSSAPARSGYSLYEENTDGTESAGAGETSGF